MRKLKQNYIITQTKKEVRLMCYKFWRLRVQRNKYGIIIVIIIITKVLIIAIRSINCKIICIVNDKHDKKLSHLKCWQGEFAQQSRASLHVVDDHFLYSSKLNLWFGSVIVNQIKRAGTPTISVIIKGGYLHFQTPTL